MLLQCEVFTASYSSTIGQDRGLDSWKQAGIAHHSDRRDTSGHTNMRSTLKKRTTLKKSSNKQGIKRCTKGHHCERNYKCRVIKKKTLGFF